MAIPRSEVAQNDRWNVEELYPNLTIWEKDFENIKGSTPAAGNSRWPVLASFKGRLGEGASILRKALMEIFQLDRKLSKLYVYAHLRHDEDIADDTFKAAQDRIRSLIQDFAQETAWFDPELLALAEEKLNAYLQDPQLKEFSFHLEKIIRQKPHTLSTEGEKLLALSGNALRACHSAFSSISDADFQFGKVLNGEGKELELTHGLYSLYIRSHDRTLRQNAFKKLHNQYSAFQNTLTELITGQVHSHWFNAKARNYNSCLEAALFPNNVDASVYHALIKAVHSKLPALHRYMKLRKQILGVDALHLYDVYVPLTGQVDLKIPYEEGEALVLESVAPLGKEYQKILADGLKKDRWVDRYENKNKRSGAYSSGCYDSMPYILMNYKDQLKDVFTLAHEAGHSMHSLLSRKNQPYHYSNYSIFVAEVASTFNEKLLMNTLMSKELSEEQRIYLVNQQIEDIRTTLFRQTMFAEYELRIHTLVEKEIPLTPKLLKEEYRKLNQTYFGPDVVIDEEIDIEWSRIPHFYYNFYVYQYATGLSAAITLFNRVLKGSDKEREEYLSFLKGGCSQYPIDLLKMAGADMRSSQPVQSAIDSFEKLVLELEGLFAKVKH